ncbi:MAG: hypothetical protein Q4E22_07080, partial [Coriobacteriia bacterium]|nr:hypothetical protein [Coriobacteriia bacterium]
LQNQNSSNYDYEDLERYTVYSRLLPLRLYDSDSSLPVITCETPFSWRVSSDKQGHIPSTDYEEMKRYKLSSSGSNYELFCEQYQGAGITQKLNHDWEAGLFERDPNRKYTTISLDEDNWVLLYANQATSSAKNELDQLSDIIASLDFAHSNSELASEVLDESQVERTMISDRIIFEGANETDMSIQGLEVDYPDNWVLHDNFIINPKNDYAIEIQVDAAYDDNAQRSEQSSKLVSLKDAQYKDGETPYSVVLYYKDAANSGDEKQFSGVQLMPLAQAQGDSSSANLEFTGNKPSGFVSQNHRIAAYIVNTNPYNDGLIDINEESFQEAVSILASIRPLQDDANTSEEKQVKKSENQWREFTKRIAQNTPNSKLETIIAYNKTDPSITLLCNFDRNIYEVLKNDKPYDYGEIREADEVRTDQIEALAYDKSYFVFSSKKFDYEGSIKYLDDDVFIVDSTNAAQSEAQAVAGVFQVISYNSSRPIEYYEKAFKPIALPYFQIPNGSSVEVLERLDGSEKVSTQYDEEEKATSALNHTFVVPEGWTAVQTRDPRHNDIILTNISSPQNDIAILMVQGVTPQTTAGTPVISRKLSNSDLVDHFGNTNEVRAYEGVLDDISGVQIVGSTYEFKYLETLDYPGKPFDIQYLEGRLFAAYLVSTRQDRQVFFDPQDPQAQEALAILSSIEFEDVQDFTFN